MRSPRCGQTNKERRKVQLEKRTKTEVLFDIKRQPGGLHKKWQEN